MVLSDSEAEVFEEGRDASEEADALDVTLLGLSQERANEEAARSVFCDVWTDDDGAHLGEVWAVDVECCTADELAGCRLDDRERANVLVYFRVGPWKECAVVRVAIDELMNGLRVSRLCFARLH